MELRIDSQHLEINSDDVKDMLADAAETAVADYDFDDDIWKACDNFDIEAVVADAVDEYDFAPAIEEALTNASEHDRYTPDELSTRIDLLYNRHSGLEALILDLGRKITHWANTPINRV